MFKAGDRVRFKSVDDEFHFKLIKWGINTNKSFKIEHVNGSKVGVSTDRGYIIYLSTKLFEVVI